MDRTLTHFIAALRNAEVRISPAETLDAMNALELVGYRDRDFLKDSLSLVLPKTADEKETFDTTFDQFFSFEDVAAQAAALAETEEGDGFGEGEGSGQGEGAGGTGTGKGGKGKGRKKGKFEAGAEEEEDLGPGEMSEPRSELGRALMHESTGRSHRAHGRRGQGSEARRNPGVHPEGPLHAQDHGRDGPCRTHARNRRSAAESRASRNGASARS